MARSCKLAFVAFVVLIGTTMAFSQVNHRPIEDFLNAQTSNAFWTDPARPERLALVDYSGIFYRFLLQQGIDLGSTFEGDVTELPLPDGRAKVHVVLHGRKVFVRGLVLPSGDSIFGGSRAEVLLGATPGLGEFLFTLDFITAGIGAPLPNWVDAPILSVQITVRAEGPLHAAFGVPEGTPGFLQMTQRALFNTGNGVPGHDFGPVEHIDIGVIGH